MEPRAVPKNQPIGFRLADLAGSIPPKHHPYRDPKSGRQLIVLGQVWVVKLSEELWEVASPLPRANASGGLVTLTRYGRFWRAHGTGRLITISLPREDLPVLMWPLEEALALKRVHATELSEQFAAGLLNREAYPTLEAVMQHLGIDPETGCRID